MRRTAFAACSLAFVGSTLHAQAPLPPDSSVRIGRTHQIASRVLGEARAYLVYEPPGSHGKPMPTVVVLDGDTHFLHTIATTRFLAEQGRMPLVRVVAIPNTADRTRDLTPPVLDARQRADFPTAGGASRMLQFIGDELLPQVEAAYGKAPMRILIGHSLGGLFAAHAMLAQPALFQAYVLVSPSFWFDGFRLRDSLTAHITHPTGSEPWVYATVGGLEPAVQTAPFARVSDSLRAHPNAMPQWHFTPLATDDHGSTPLKTTYDALELLFRSFRIPTDSSRALGIGGIDRHYAALRTRFGYPDHAPEAALNTLGYELLADSSNTGRVQGAAAFRENIRRFPRSANTYDSLGDALRALGNPARAHGCYAAAVYLGRTAPREGESFANALLIPGASIKMTEMARQLGRTAWAVADVPERVMSECVAAG